MITKLSSITGVSKKIDRVGTRVGDWEAYLGKPGPNEELDSLRRNSRTGRPLGDDGFVESLEQLTGRALKRRKPGPK